jgi:hypothetical protein
MLNLFKRLFGRGQKARRPSPQRGSCGETSHARNPALSRSPPAAVDPLDNPDLEIDTPPDTGFDPYNTGTFNRSGSWERINKRRSS